MRAARAMALLTGKNTVTPELVQRLLEPVLAHRLIFRDSALLEMESRRAFWQSLLESVPVPDYAERAETTAG